MARLEKLMDDAQCRKVRGHAQHDTQLRVLL